MKGLRFSGLDYVPVSEYIFVSSVIENKGRGGGSTTISTTVSTTLSKFITVNATRIKVLSSGNGQGFDKTVFIYDN